jgi:nucleoside-diphosphate-sugar epimerase
MGTPLTVWKTAYDQKRPYLDLTDAIRAMAHFLKSDEFDGRVYNAVTLNATVREVVDSIKTFIPDLQVEFVDSQIMNQLSYEVLNTRLDEKNFIFQGDLRQGIKETIFLLKQAASHQSKISGFK